MFGDLVLRLPDVVHDLYDRNKEWNALIGWSVWFASESKVFEGGNEKLLNLVRLLGFLVSTLGQILASSSVRYEL